MQKAFTFLISMVWCFSAYGQIFQEQDSLYYEVPDTANINNKDFFNLDNHIYQPDREFIYSYLLIKNSDTLQVRTSERHDTKTKNWSFVKREDADSLTIKYLSFKVQAGYGGLDHLFPDYSQTVIQQRYYSPSFELLFDGATGLVENEKNIWVHPFRGKYFSVLQFSPFPYVKLPLQIGTTWSWKLDNISERWSDARIKEYEGKQTAMYLYKIVGRKTLKTAFGLKDCYVTESTAKTTLGLTRLTSFFNPQYGFVRLEYSNIDGGLIILELVGIKHHR